MGNPRIPGSVSLEIIPEHGIPPPRLDKQTLARFRPGELIPVGRRRHADDIWEIRLTARTVSLQVDKDAAQAVIRPERPLWVVCLGHRLLEPIRVDAESLSALVLDNLYRLRVDMLHISEQRFHSL